MLKSTLYLAMSASLLLNIANVSGTAFAQTSNSEVVDKLVTALKSNAPEKDKADACRLLAVVGNKTAVPALAALLSDEKLSHMARFGLETIPDPSVDEAFLKALGELKGRLLVGVIGSIGVRRDSKSIQPLSRFLADSDPDVAQAAARALGKIGTDDAAKAVEGALPTTAPANVVAFCEGLFRCAEFLAANGKKAEAIRIFQKLMINPQLPHQVHAGALRGMILNDNEGLSYMIQGIISDDYILTAAAARTALEVKKEGVARLIAAQLPKLPVFKQILFTQTLGKLGDAEALPTLITLARSGDKTVRLEAIRALPEIGAPGAVPAFVELAQDADKDIVAAAQDALAGFRGKEADAAVMALLENKDTAKCLLGIDLSARRRLKEAMPILSKLSSGEDQQVRLASLKRLGELGGPAELQAMLDLVLKTSNAQELAALEQGLIAICSSAGTPDESADKLVATLAKAEPAQKGTVIRVLGGVGGAKALKAVRDAVNDSDDKVHSTAIRTLGDWKSADAAEVLLDLAKTSTKTTDKVLSLRGYLNIAGGSDVKGPQKLAMCKTAINLAQRDEEKKMILGVLGGLANVEAANVIVPFLSNAGTQVEAASAILAVGEKVLQGGRNPQAAPKLVEPLQKVIDTVSNADLKKKAEAQLTRAKAVK